MPKSLITLLFILSYFNIFSQNFNSFLSLYEKFSNEYIFENVYIHTDKNHYNSNNKIFFKIYVWDAKLRQPSKIQQYINVELISPDKEIIAHKKLLSENGTASSYFEFSDTIPEANYQIRAFTNSMKNFDSEFFFTKSIFLATGNFIFSAEYYKSGRKLKRNNKKSIITYNDALYPKDNKIFRNIFAYTTDNQYNKTSFTYQISNKKQNVSNSGTINYNQPISIEYFIDNKYFLLLKNDNFKKVKIKLPTISSLNQPVINTTKSNNFKIFFLSDTNTFSKNFLLIIEKDGTIYYKNFIKNKNDTIELLYNDFPRSKLNCYFINTSGEVEFFRTINNIYKLENSSTKIQTSITNDTLFLSFENENLIDTAYLSISVSNDTSIQRNIANYFNFYSDLPYSLQLFDFQEINTNFPFPQKSYKYDLNNLPDLTTKDKNIPQKTISITGHISYILEKIPAKNAKVTLTILNTYNDIFYTTTDSDGKFKFDNLTYPDTIEYLLTAQTQNDKKHTIIYVDQYDTCDIYFFPFKNIDLSTIKHSDTYKTTDLPNRGAIYSHPDQVFTEKDFANSGQTTVLDVLNGRVPGLQINGNSVIFRGISSINLSNEPLYLLNNVPVDVNAIQSLNINDVERIEVVKNSSSSAIYGSRGANGIISVYTKQGYNITWGKATGYTMGKASNLKFIENKTINKWHTFYWNPNIIITTNKISIKIPIKNSKNIKINIQGFTNSGRFTHYNKTIKI